MVDSSGEEEIRRISKYCRKLKDVDITGPNLNTSAFSKCLVSNAGQLEHAVIRRMKQRDLKTVLKICPNSKFSLQYQRPDLVNCMKMMGKRLIKVGFGDFPHYDNISSDQTGAWDACPNVREIDMDRELQLCDFRAIFNTPKVFLKDLSLHVVDFKSLDVFAAGAVTALESAAFWCGFPPKNAFNALVRKNKTLRKAHIVINMPEDTPDNLGERVLEMATCFLNSPALQSLYIADGYDGKSPEDESPGCFDPVRELLRSKYRHRRVQVILCGAIV